MAKPLDPLLMRDFRAGRITPYVISDSLAPENSVKDSLNVNFDEIVGSAKVRYGTTGIGDGPGVDGFMPQGLAEFVPGSGATLGPELVTNGTFTGSATGWTLGNGWTYSSNSVTWTNLGVELVTNGSFTGGTTGWTLGAAWTYGTDNVHCDGTSGALSQSLASVDGETYRLSFDVSGVTGSKNLVSTVGLSTTGGVHSVSNGSYSYDQVSSGTQGVYFSVYTPGGSPFIGDIDNVSVKFLNQGTLSQDIGAVSSYLYELSADVGGSTGYITIAIGSNSFTIAAGGTVTQQLVATDGSVTITASDDFDGTVDSVSVKQVLNNYLLVVYNGVSEATLYYWNGSVWNDSDLTLTNDVRDRFTVFGGRAFVTNSSDGMFSSPDAETWTAGAAADCIDAGDAKPAYIFRYKQRLLAAGDPIYPDRVFFSSIIDPVSTPFITWDTDPSTGDWIDVNPDDGGNITGFSETSTFCLIFKDTGMYRMDTVSKTVNPDNIFDVGAVSQEAIVLCMGVTYFFSGNGIYRTNGGYPEQISRAGVQDIIESMDPDQSDNVRSGTDGLNVYFSVGQITFNKNQSTEKVVDNVVLKYSPRDESWAVHAYRDYFGFYAQYTDQNGTLLRAASDAGNVQTLNLGSLDNSIGSIPFFLETQDQEFGNRAHQKGIANNVVVFTNNGLSSSFAARQDGGNVKPIKMELSKRVNLGKDINLQGNYFNFYWSGNANGGSPVFEGFYLEDITDNGMQDATGQTDMISPPNFLTS